VLRKDAYFSKYRQGLLVTCCFRRSVEAPDLVPIGPRHKYAILVEAVLALETRYFR
jgi:hypothetical protein